MKKILITGSNGFIGSVLKRKLLSIGYEISGIDLPDDITEPGTFVNFEKHNIDHVFHLAAKTFVPDSWMDPQLFYRTNLLGTLNVLEFCRKNNTSLTYVSAYLYGQPQRLPISEKDPIQHGNPYAHTKYLAEQMCEFYSKEFGVNTIIIRPFNVYGVGQSEKFLIPSIIKQALEEETIKVKHLAPRRDYIYLDDLIDALILSMSSSKKYAVYNIGSGTSVSVEEVISTVKQIIGTNKKVISGNTIRRNEINDVVADISQANRDLGWFPRKTFIEGLKEMVEQVKNNTQEIPINKGNYSMETPEREVSFETMRAEGWEEEYYIYRKNWSEFAKNKTISEYPLLVDTELASICNLKCPMCYTITDEFKKKVKVKVMDFELFKKIVDEIGGKVPALRLSLRGEPTLHPKFIDCVAYAKQKGIKEISFLTNCSKLTREFFEKIMLAGVDWITISIDGLDDVYEGIRKPLKFRETFQKVLEMQDVKKQYGRHKPVIKIQAIWPSIKKDPNAYYQKFNSHVDLIAFNPLIDYLGNDTDIVYEENFSCPQHYQRLVIGADGLAMMCSNDEEGSVIIGDANHETIYNIWHGEKLNHVREQHKKRNGFLEIPVCTKCYLPRATEDGEISVVNGRKLIIKNYVNRNQEIGR